MKNTLNGLAISFEDGKWKKLVKKLAQEEFKPRAGKIDKEGIFPKENIASLGNHKLLGIGIPKEYGGVGGDVKTTTIIVEELAVACPSTAMCYLMHISLVPILSRLANPEQIERFIKPIIEGNSLGSYSMSEPGTGSRLWHMDSFAKNMGDVYEINSFKSFSTSSGNCQFYLLAVKADEHASSNELSIFLVDAKNPDIKIIGKWDGMGLRGNSSTPVHFDNCLVAKDRLFGTPKCGYNLIMAYTFPPYVIGLSAVYLGIARKAYEAAVERVMKRSYTDSEKNNSLRDVETIQRYVGEMKVKIDAVKAQIERIANLTAEYTKVFDELLEAEMLDELLQNAQDDEFFLKLSQIKISACEMAIEVTNMAMQVCGGSGYRRGSVVEQCYRDARAGSLMGPSDDILKLIIGKRVLGLPFPWKEEHYLSQTTQKSTTE